MLATDDDRHEDDVAQPHECNIVERQRGESGYVGREEVKDDDRGSNPERRLGPHVFRDEPAQHLDGPCGPLEDRRHGDQLGVVPLGTLHGCPRLGHASFWLNSRSVSKRALEESVASRLDALSAFHYLS